MKRILILLAIMAIFVACNSAKTPVDKICNLSEELMVSMTKEGADENPDLFVKAFALLGVFEENKDYVLTDADKAKLGDIVEKAAKLSKEQQVDSEDLDEIAENVREVLKEAKTLGDVQKLIDF